MTIPPTIMRAPHYSLGDVVSRNQMNGNGLCVLATAAM